MALTRAILVTLALALLPSIAGAQQTNTFPTSPATAGGATAQGTPAASTDAAAWPVKIIFGSTQIDPRDVSDRAARALGKITFDGAQAVTQSGSWSVSFTAPQHVVCDSGCAAGTPGQATMAASSPVVIASDQTAVPVSVAVLPSHAVTNAGTFAVQVTSAPTTSVTGTFWQATQPISAVALPLPSNAAQETGGNLATLAAKDFATSAKQDTGNTSLGTIATNTTGVATAANQTTALASLVSIDGKTPGFSTAGNSSSNVATVQGSAGATPIAVVAVRALPLQPCNAVRRTNCSPKGW